MDRRTFLARAGLVATWAAIPITITSCGDDDPSPTEGGGNGDVPGSVGVSGGHTHAVVITRAQIDAANAVILTLTGGGHTHTVALTEDEVMDIGEGRRVTKQSSDDLAHSHSVTFH